MREAVKPHGLRERRITPVEKAKRRLRGQWTDAVTAECVLLCVRILFPLSELGLLTLTGLGVGGHRLIYTASTAVLLLADWLLISPLLIGRTMLYWDISQGRQSSSSRIWQGFRFYGKSIAWRLGLFIRRVFWGLLFYLPFAALMISAPYFRAMPVSFYSDVMLLICTIGAPLFLIAGFAGHEYFMLRYAASGCLIAASEGRISLRGIFRRAKQVSKRKTGELVWLAIRFSGWFILSLLILPAAYAFPLYRSSQTVILRRWLLICDGE